jgi:hypothetical protein
MDRLLTLYYYPFPSPRTAMWGRLAGIPSGSGRLGAPSGPGLLAARTIPQPRRRHLHPAALWDRPTPALEDKWIAS